MAVSKLWSVTSRLGQVIDYAANPEKTAADIYTEEQYQALRDVLSYAKDEEKTEREFFVEGINCNPATARDQFISVKKAYGKDDGIQAYHGYLSFKEQDINTTIASAASSGWQNPQRRICLGISPAAARAVCTIARILSSVSVSSPAVPMN